MDAHSRRVVPANDRMRIGNPPRQRRRRSPITIARQEAADATNRMPDRDRRRHSIHDFQPPEPVVTDTESDADNSADQPAIPGKSCTGQNQREGVSKKFAPMLDDE